jgi:hypothetical protein
LYCTCNKLQCGEEIPRAQLWQAHNRDTAAALHQTVYIHLQGLLLLISSAIFTLSNQLTQQSKDEIMVSIKVMP